MKSAVEVKQLVDSLLGSTRLPPGVDGEINYIQNQSRSASWADGRPHFQDVAMTESVCLRVLDKGGQGVLTTRTLDPDHFVELGARASQIARVSSVDTHRALGRPAGRYPEAVRVDMSLFARSIDEILDDLSRLEKKVLKIDSRIKKVIKFITTENRSMKGLANSHSVNLVAESSFSNFVAEVLAEDKGESEVAWDFQSHRFSDGGSIEPVAEAVAVHALQALGGKPLRSGKYNVAVHPRVGAQLLDLVSKALSAEAVQCGRSFFRGLLNQPIASPHVTLVDDPLLPDGINSIPFDDEGTPHRTCGMIENGVLKDYFFDLRSASKDGRESNGHGIKETLSAVPRPASTNFFMKPASTSIQAMLASHEKVFHLRDVMGLHMADPITGEFSLGASGFLYENGRLSHPVRGVTVAGTLMSILKGIAAVGSDLTWHGSVGAPSFLVSQVTIAGI